MVFQVLHWYKGCGFNSRWRSGIFLHLQRIHCIFCCQTSYLQNFNVKISYWKFVGSWWESISGCSCSQVDNITTTHALWYDTVSVCNDIEIWVTYINNVLSNKTILFDILDFWCQLVVIRFVKTLSKRRMFISSMKISACWLLHRDQNLLRKEFLISIMYYRTKRFFSIF